MIAPVAVVERGTQREEVIALGEVEKRPLSLIFNGEPVPTMLASDFMVADSRRPTSFITNFGNWQLPPSATEQLHSPVAHLEWFHDTGELVAFSHVPRLGTGEIDVPDTQAAVDTLAGPLGGASGRVVHTPDGATREFFPAMILDPDTLVAVLAVVEYGPRVHHLLWAWHIEHRRAGGWAWLEDRLREHHPEHPDTSFI